MNTKNIWLFAGVLGAVVVAGVFLLRKPAPAPVSSPTPTTKEESTKTQEPSSTNDKNSTVIEIEVSGKEFSFDPSATSVKKGQKVKIVFKNEGTMTHDFVIEELSLRTKVIRPGETDTLEFTVPEKGSTLTYFCSVGSHRALGMEGTFTIE